MPRGGGDGYLDLQAAASDASELSELSELSCHSTDARAASDGGDMSDDPEDDAPHRRRDATDRMMQLDAEAAECVAEEAALRARAAPSLAASRWTEGDTLTQSPKRSRQQPPAPPAIKRHRGQPPTPAEVEMSCDATTTRRGHRTLAIEVEVEAGTQEFDDLDMLVDSGHATCTVKRDAERVPRVVMTVCMRSTGVGAPALCFEHSVQPGHSVVSAPMEVQQVSSLLPELRALELLDVAVAVALRSVGAPVGHGSSVQQTMIQTMAERGMCESPLVTRLLLDMVRHLTAICDTDPTLPLVVDPSELLLARITTRHALG